MSISYISEFSFGFAVTNEICQVLASYGFSGAPSFPNLRQEHLRGYDVEIPLRGFPLFLQFKLSELMETKRAKEWTQYNAPYFRVHLHNRCKSDQHKHLQQLAKDGLYVCYVSPMFNKSSELNDAFLAKPPQIVRKSMFIEVNRLPPLPDDKNHNFTFLRGDDLKFWSESVNIDGKFTGDIFLEKIIGLLKNENNLHELNSNFFYKLSAYMHNMIAHQEIPSEIQKQKSDLIEDIVYMCRVYLGCEILFIGLSDREEVNDKPKKLGRMAYVQL